MLPLATTPVNAQEREWTLDRTDQDVFLVFGTPETDDVGASFWCRIGTPTVRFFLPLPQSRPHARIPSSLKLSVSGKTFTLPVLLNKDESRESNTLEAEFATESPLFEVLRSADYFAVSFGNGKRIFPLVNADVEGLLRLCTSPPPGQE